MRGREQSARSAAQAGTATGVGGVEGEGIGLELGLELGLGLGDGVGEGLVLVDGLELADADAPAEQPATTSMIPRRATPPLT